MSKTNQPMSTPHHDVVKVMGSFAPAAAGNPTAVFGSAEFTVVRNGTAGEWKITFVEPYAQLLGENATIRMAAATDLKPQFATFTPATTGVPASILLRALAVATPTDIAANANNRVSFEMNFRTTTYQV